jgi:hypothetical protein
MDYEYEIIRGFKDFVSKTFDNSDVKNFLINHERLPLLVTNLTKQMKDAEYILIPSKSTMPEKRKILSGIIEGFSQTFCSAAINFKEKEMNKNKIIRI